MLQSYWDNPGVRFLTILYFTILAGALICYDWKTIKTKKQFLFRLLFVFSWPISFPLYPFSIMLKSFCNYWNSLQN